MKNKKGIVMLALHILLLIYSLGSVCSKKASGFPFLSFKFILFYCCVMAILFIYAIGWQQIIKRMPLTAAYANKAVTVVWGIIWGIIFFGEKVTPGKIVGAVVVITGVVLYAFSDRQEEKEDMKKGEQHE